MPEEAPSGAARERAWRLTQEARALASAGDTTAVAALADTIGAVGANSGHVRDRRLDRYVRGLVLFARNDLVGAEAAFRSALYSLPAGYTRVNCELGDELLRLGRPRDAVAVVQPALRGKVDASNYYVTHTEVHALLARASGRQRETAIRVAIGASRTRVIRQMLTESILLAFAGSVGGLMFAVAGIDWLLAMLPAGSLPRQGGVALDVRVFAVAAAAALATGVFTGLLPAASLFRASATGAFHDGARPRLGHDARGNRRVETDAGLPRDRHRL